MAKFLGLKTALHGDAPCKLHLIVVVAPLQLNCK